HSAAGPTQTTRLSERDLLALMLVPSGNNVARLLARWDAGAGISRQWLHKQYVRRGRSSEDLGAELGL
ncbi:hypothetical protein ACWDN5_44690, partial [Amycolatopsis sp. NPDC003731]